MGLTQCYKARKEWIWISNQNPDITSTHISQWFDSLPLLAQSMTLTMIATEHGTVTELIQAWISV
jgi:hypothetical protein